MTEDEIILDWFQRDSNIAKLPLIAYSDEVYNFIISTCSKWGKDIYKVNGDWQIVIRKTQKIKPMNKEYRARVFFYDGIDYATGEMLSAEEAYSENYIDWVGNTLKPTDECSIIMFWTGLKDKNNIDIYEGDYDADFNVVAWCENRNGWALKVYDFSTKSFALCHCCSCEGNFEISELPIKVCGNIYENNTQDINNELLNTKQ